MNTSPAHTEHIEEKQVSDFFGFSDMSDDEKVEFLDTVGTTIFESALIRYLADATPDEAETFQKFVETHQDDEGAFEKIATEFPTFAKLVFEEATAFRAEVLGVATPTSSLST